jgi:UDP-hydrolysing UDP-N-acetyl-D-glucosamine 2-epimerase
MKKKIAVFTSTRADYGHLYWIIRNLHNNLSVELQIYAGGTHLKKAFGMTVDKIEEDGFIITEKIDYLEDKDDPKSICSSISNVAKISADILNRRKPDMLVLLGDRYELMPIAQTAMVFNIPIAHIHGGERTEGAIDDAVRHCLTKMSHIHFAATEQYKNRIMQLGENIKNVFNYGAPGLDNLYELNLLSLKELEKELDFTLTENFFLVTYHPLTINESSSNITGLLEIFEALERFPDYKLLITYPNADTHGSKIIDYLKIYKSKNSQRVMLTKSLGQLRYLSALRKAKAVIGNSSSGIIEAPTFKIPTINIGDRQKGRVCGATVISTKEKASSIYSKIKYALSPEFTKICECSDNPYGGRGASDKIAEKLVSIETNGIINKTFQDFK